MNSLPPKDDLDEELTFEDDFGEPIDLDFLQNEDEALTQRMFQKSLYPDLETANSER